VDSDVEGAHGKAQRTKRYHSLSDTMFLREKGLREKNRGSDNVTVPGSCVSAEVQTRFDESRGNGDRAGPFSRGNKKYGGEEARGGRDTIC